MDFGTEYTSGYFIISESADEIFPRHYPESLEFRRKTTTGKDLQNSLRELSFHVVHC